MPNSETLESAYLLGRAAGNLDGVTSGSDIAFGSTRLDGQELRDWDFKHCTFANISFKNSPLQDCKFLNCIFVDCYFRRSTLTNSHFVGCRFVDCNFSYVSIQSSHFKYSSFRKCQIPFAELRHSLPTEANLRESLAHNLFVESRALGLRAEARSYRLAALTAKEADLRAGISGESEWYRTHFEGSKRFRARRQLWFSRFNRYAWGYGESSWRLLWNVLLVSIVVFPALFYATRSGLSSGNGGAVGLWDIIYFSVETAFPAPLGSDIEAVGYLARALAIAESLLGFVFVALFASNVFRWSLDR